jgi:iron complex transport system substrate-binding protein
MNYRIWYNLLLRLMAACGVLACALLLAGCADTSERTAARSVTDDLGRTTQVPTSPQRVIPLAPNLTEMLYAAGAGGAVAGVSQSDDYPPETEALPRFSSFPLDVEGVVALDPDLILANPSINAPRDAEPFEALGIPVLFYDFASWSDVLGGIETLGALFGTETAADAARDSLGAAMVSLRTRTAQMGEAERPRVLFLIGTETLYTFGGGSYVHDLVDAAGGRSLTASFETPAPVLSDEYVLTAAPEVIVGTFSDTLTAAGLLAQHPTWDLVPAITSGRIVALDGDHWLRAGPRNVLAAHDLAQHLHPTLFGQ